MHIRPTYTMQPSHQHALTHSLSIAPPSSGMFFFSFFSLTSYSYMSPAHSPAPATTPICTQPHPLTRNHMPKKMNARCDTLIHKNDSGETACVFHLIFHCVSTNTSTNT